MLSLFFSASLFSWDIVANIIFAEEFRESCVVRETQTRTRRVFPSLWLVILLIYSASGHLRDFVFLFFLLIEETQ